MDWVLANKVAKVIAESFEEQCRETGSFAADQMAKAVLAIPEIAEAQKRIAELEEQLEAERDDAHGYRTHPDTWA